MAHPLPLAALVVDLAALALLAASAMTGLRVLMGWAPGSASAAQLRLERCAELSSAQGRLAALLFLFSTLLVVVAIASALPAIVPGAMCGTGVLQAAGPAGERALLLRGVALAALFGWHLLDRLNRSSQLGELTPLAARASLLALPAVALAGLETALALLRIDQAEAVDCCSVVFDAARSRGAASGAWAPSLPWVPIIGAGSLLLAALGVATFMSERARRSRLLAAALAGCALLWVPLAAVGLVRHLAAYHYGVLAHDCPWCLFAGRHHLVGYPLFGALLVVALEGGGGLLLRGVARRAPSAAVAATSRLRRAALRLAIAALLFAALALGPALAYRLGRGAWIDP